MKGPDQCEGTTEYTAVLNLETNKKRRGEVGKKREDRIYANNGECQFLQGLPWQKKLGKTENPDEKRTPCDL